MYVHAPLAASIEAVPFVELAVTLKIVPSAKPSSSVAESVPVISVSSSAVPLISPLITVVSLTAFTVTLTVVVSVTPPLVTVYV